MPTPVITIAVDAVPSAALRLMLTHKTKRLPVVDENGRLARGLMVSTSVPFEVDRQAVAA